jgi:hypothetical protein
MSATATTKTAEKARDGFNPAYKSKGFTGDTCWIKLGAKTRTTDKAEEFFGISGTGPKGAFDYHITIKRNKWVEVPVEMADHIASLTVREKEPDPEDPDNPDKFVWVENDRFPMNRQDKKPAEAKKAEQAAEMMA